MGGEPGHGTRKDCGTRRRMERLLPRVDTVQGEQVEWGRRLKCPEIPEDQRLAVCAPDDELRGLGGKIGTVVSAAPQHDLGELANVPVAHIYALTVLRVAERLTVETVSVTERDIPRDMARGLQRERPRGSSRDVGEEVRGLDVDGSSVHRRSQIDGAGSEELAEDHDENDSERMHSRDPFGSKRCCWLERPDDESTNVKLYLIFCYLSIK